MDPARTPPDPAAVPGAIPQARTLLWGFASILALAAVSYLAVIAYSYSLADKAGLLYVHPFTVSVAIKRVELDSAKLRLAMKDATLAESPGELEAALEDARRREAAIASSLATVRERYLGPPSDVDRLATALDSWKAAREEVLSLARQGRGAEAARITKGVSADRFAQVEEAAAVIAEFAGNKALFFMNQAGEVTWEVIRVVAVSGTLLVIAGGAIAARAVRSLRRAQSEVDKSRSLVQNIIDSMPSVVVGVDADGRVTHLNREAGRRLGEGAPSPLGEPLERAFPGYAGHMGAVRKAMEERAPVHLERLPAMEGGRARYRDVLVYPLVANGVDGAVLRVDDVTRRARLEEMVAQSEKMLVVGGLAAGMAHEINNPLGVILQSIQMLCLRMDPEMEKNREAARECGCDLGALGCYFEDRRIRDFLENIREAGVRAARIVADMLEFSNLSDQDKTAVDLAPVLDKALELAASDCGLKGAVDFKAIAVTREYAPDVPPALCSPKQIRQVAVNLIKNAAQSVTQPRDGAPAPAPAMALRLRTEGAMVAFEVEDNGPGMDDGVRRRVFEPFFTTRAPGGGAGMGLSVCYFTVVNNHGGSISVDSSPGKGARFTVTLPAA